MGPIKVLANNQKLWTISSIVISNHLTSFESQLGVKNAEAGCHTEAAQMEPDDTTLLCRRLTACVVTGNEASLSGKQIPNPLYQFKPNINPWRTNVGCYHCTEIFSPLFIRKRRTNVQIIYMVPSVSTSNPVHKIVLT